MRATLTPASGLNSNVVTTGPGLICVTCPSTPNSADFCTSTRASSRNASSRTMACSSFRYSNEDGGSLYPRTLFGTMVTGLMSASARLPNEMPSGNGAGGAGNEAAGSSTTFFAARVGAAVFTCGNSSESKREPRSLKFELSSSAWTGAAAFASASAKGAAAAAAVLYAVAGGASTRVRGIPCHIEGCGPGAATSSAATDIGSTGFFLLNQPKSPPSRVVLFGSSRLRSASSASARVRRAFASACSRLLPYDSSIASCEPARLARRCAHHSHKRCTKPNRIVAHSRAVLKVNVVAR